MSDYADSVSRLILQRGGARAQNAQNQGQIWGNFIQSIPEAAQRAIEMREQKKQQEQQQARQQEQDAQRRQQAANVAEDRALETQQRHTAEEIQTAARDAYEKIKTGNADEVLGTLRPESRVIAEKWLSDFSESKAQRAAQTQKDIKGAAQTLQAMNYDPVAGAIQIKLLSEIYPDANEVLDHVHEPAVFKGIVDKFATLGDKPPEPYTLANGAQRRGPNNELLADNPLEVKPDAAPKVGTFEDYLARVAGARNKTPAMLSPLDIRNAKAEYEAAGRAPKDPTVRYQSKEILNDEGKPVTVNFDAVSGQYLDPSTKQPIKNPRPVPSAQEMMDSRKFQKSAPVLSAIGELSEKINTGSGLIAKAVGGAAKVAAKANYDDDVAEYQALVSGFTPLVARSLGHTGVLTQQDVDSVKELFPKPGDSKTLRDRKVNRLMGIIGQLEGTEGVPKAGAPKPLNAADLIKKYGG